VRHVGIVGAEAAKFTPITAATAKSIIAELVRPDVTVVSGHCPLGGVDIWAEDAAAAAGRPTRIFAPQHQRWADGYKPRNLSIASIADIVHVITVAELPPGFRGRRFASCYHCAGLADGTGKWPAPTSHIKSGGCWTARRALDFSKPATWYIIAPDGGFTVKGDIA